ncbi:MAG: hypothetical protein J6Z36_00675, partial [Clostridia bacterium]|nr:hypothetical protein [Clostridia bacterium]
SETAEVSITISQSQLASYDAYEKKTYRMDRGEYFLILAADAHDAAKQAVEKYKSSSVSDNLFVYEQAEDVLYDVSDTGYPITNRFQTEKYTSLPEDLPLLSRADWQGTFPTPYGDGGVAGKAVKELTGTKKAAILSTDHLGPNNDEVDYVYNFATQTVETVHIGKAVTNSRKGLNFIDMVDKNGKVADYDDKKWQDLVECMTVKELYKFLSSGFGQSAQINSINKRRTDTSDSPMGLHSGTLFPCYPIQAATWSVETAQSIAECVAEEALWNGIHGWYAPACNMHRTPFGGRNYEYYSEDGTLSGKYIAAVVKTAQANGLFVQMKHFALNDQDTTRGDRGNFKNGDPYNGLCTYANEQCIREIYLKPFQYGVEEGGAHGVMTSYNRIGDTWAGGHYGLLTEVLRNEWGMKGNALTDYAGTFGYKYMNFGQGLRAGNDLWLHPSNAFPTDDYTSDAAIYYMQKAAKDVLYAEACSSRINNQRYTDGSSVIVKTTYAPWRWLVGIIYGVVMLGSLFGIVILLKKVP